MLERVQRKRKPFTLFVGMQTNTATKLHKPDNHDGVITHLEPDILECEVITMNKIVEVMEFQLSYFRS